MRNFLHISFDEGPEQPPRDPVPGECYHPIADRAPLGYIHRQTWFKKMAKTHRQKLCPECGLWRIWEAR